MPQEFQVLQCFRCKTFQVHQVKKALKWACKLCGEKQSVIKVFGRGTGADCRHHVQRLNTMRGELETSVTSLDNRTDVLGTQSTGYTHSGRDHGLENVELQLQEASEGKWEQFVEQDDTPATEDVEDVEDRLYTTDATLMRSRGRGQKRQSYGRDSGYSKRRKTEKTSHYRSDKSDSFPESDSFDSPDGNSYYSNNKKADNRFTAQESSNRASDKWGQYTDYPSESDIGRSLTFTDFPETSAQIDNIVGALEKPRNYSLEQAAVTRFAKSTDDMHYNKKQNSHSGRGFRKSQDECTVNKPKPTAVSKWNNYLDEEQEDESKTHSEEYKYFTEEVDIPVKSKINLGKNTGKSKWDSFIEENTEDNQNSASENISSIEGTNEIDVNSKHFQYESRKPLKNTNLNDNMSVTSKWSSFVRDSRTDTKVLDDKGDKVPISNTFVAPFKSAEYQPDSTTDMKQSIFSLGDLSDDDLEFDL